jgi:F-type H+-transporting ATPase subunit b
MINIVILFLFLRWLIYKPISKFLKNRTNGIQKQIDEAARMQTEAEQIKSKYDEMMGNAQDLAAQIVNQGKGIAEEQSRQIVQEAESQAMEIRGRTQRHIREQKKQAVIDMRREVTRIAVQIAEKVLEREVSYEDNKDIIDKFFDKVG